MRQFLQSRYDLLFGGIGLPLLGRLFLLGCGFGCFFSFCCGFGFGFGDYRFFSDRLSLCFGNFCRFCVFYWVFYYFVFFQLSLLVEDVFLRVHHVTDFWFVIQVSFMRLCCCIDWTKVVKFFELP